MAGLGIFRSCTHPPRLRYRFGFLISRHLADYASITPIRHPEVITQGGQATQTQTRVVTFGLRRTP